jgi:hypothetical protein
MGSSAGPASLNAGRLTISHIGEAEPVVVVPVVGVVVVAIGNPAVGSVVVPATAPQDTVVACVADDPFGGLFMETEHRDAKTQRLGNQMVSP